MEQRFRLVRRGFSQGADPEVEVLDVPDALSQSLRWRADRYLRDRWEESVQRGIVGIYAFDRSSSRPRWWTRHHGHVNTTDDTAAAFERDFLTYAEPGQMLCVPVRGQRHDYGVYVLGSSPEDVARTWDVAEVLLS